MLSEEVRHSSQCSGWSIAWMVGHVTDGGERVPSACEPPSEGAKGTVVPVGLSPQELCWGETRGVTGIGVVFEVTVCACQARECGMRTTVWEGAPVETVQPR